MMVPIGSPIANGLVVLLVIYWWVMVFRMLVDTAPGLRSSLGKEYGYLFRATEPVIRPFRRWVPPAWGVDLSVIATLLSLLILKELVIFVARQF